jgi:hypothetical protein
MSPLQVLLSPGICYDACPDITVAARRSEKTGMTEEHGRKRRRLIGIGFITAFLLSTATIIYTGLNVRAPGSHRAQESSPALPATADPAAAEQPDAEEAPSETAHP